MTETTMTPLNGCQPRHFARGGDTVALWLSGDGELWQGLAPDNPAIRNLSYLVIRNHLPQARFVCLWDLANRAPLTEVTVHHTPVGTQITFWRGERVTHVTLYDEPGKRPDAILPLAESGLTSVHGVIYSSSSSKRATIRSPVCVARSSLATSAMASPLLIPLAISS